MGGLRKLMPITGATYLIACAAIAGFPLLSGFFSKDEILWKAFDSGNILLPGGGIVLCVLAAIAALVTSFYMFRSLLHDLQRRVSRRVGAGARRRGRRCRARDGDGARDHGRPRPARTATAPCRTSRRGR